jgi:polyvinyl alcohol dehydrogenase (cytochrome)
VKANVYAIDARAGAQLWMKSAESHPLARVTGAPILHDGRLYVPVASFEEGVRTESEIRVLHVPRFGRRLRCGIRRSGLEVVHDSRAAAADEEEFDRHAAVGTCRARRCGPRRPSTSKRGVLYVATGDAYTSPPRRPSDAVMAFDLKSGIPMWTHQFTPNDAFLVGCPPGPSTRDNCPEVGGPDFDFGSSPMLRTLANGKSVLVVGQKSGAAWAIDPDKDGALVWQHKVGVGSALGGIEWGSAADDRQAYFATADQSLGVKAGGLAALNLATGEEVWKVTPPAMDCGNGRPCAQAQSAAITAIPGVVFSGTTTGVIRAYAGSRRQDSLGVRHGAPVRDRQRQSPRKAGRSTGPAPSSSTAWCS